jgi:hypothetical protein
LKEKFCAKNCRIYKKEKKCIAKLMTKKKCHMVKSKECEEYKHWKTCKEHETHKKCIHKKTIKFCKKYIKKKVCKKFIKKKYCIRRKKCCGVCKKVTYAWDKK